MRCRYRRSKPCCHPAPSRSQTITHRLHLKANRSKSCWSVELCSPVDMGEHVRAYCHLHGKRSPAFPLHHEDDWVGSLFQCSVPSDGARCRVELPGGTTLTARVLPGSLKLRCHRQSGPLLIFRRSPQTICRPCCCLLPRTISAWQQEELAVDAGGALDGTAALGVGHLTVKHSCTCMSEAFHSRLRWRPTLGIYHRRCSIEQRWAKSAKCYAGGLIGYSSL